MARLDEQVDHINSAVRFQIELQKVGSPFNSFRALGLKSGGIVVTEISYLKPF
jgi:hypothetical protein